MKLKPNVWYEIAVPKRWWLPCSFPTLLAFIFIGIKIVNDAEVF